MICKEKREDFLANTSNKVNLIQMLATHFNSCGLKATICQADADVPLVQEALEYAKYQVTILVGDDTDLLVLLCFYPNQDFDVFLKSEPKKTQKRKKSAAVDKLWNIRKTKEALGDTVCNTILFVHALLGCDTTSRLFNIGKATALHKCQQDEAFVANAIMFVEGNASQEEIVEAGERALLIVYGGASSTSLDDLRYKAYCRKVASRKCVLDTKALPPTSNAAKYHSFRVYLQVQEWLGYKLYPTMWGWKQEGGSWIARQTDKDVAPKDLLNVVRCSCKTDCDKRKCTCKKHGLKCTVACKHCQGVSCLNCQSVEDCSDDE